MNKVKNKSHMILLIDVEKVFDKLQKLEANWVKRGYPLAQCTTRVVNVRFISVKIWNQIRMPDFTTAINMILKVIPESSGKKKCSKCYKLERRNPNYPSLLMM